MSDLHCEPHGWWLEEGELCPVCEGMIIERERIVRLLEFEEFYEAVAFLISEYPDVARVSENNDKGE